jgi:hypothetical protein
MSTSLPASDYIPCGAALATLGVAVPSVALAAIAARRAPETISFEISSLATASSTARWFVQVDRSAVAATRLRRLRLRVPV